MHQNDITRENMVNLTKFCKFQLGGGGGVNLILKKVGLYLQMTHISSATHPKLLNLLAN